MPKAMGRDIEKEMGLPKSYTLSSISGQANAAKKTQDRDSLSAMLEYSHDSVEVRAAVGGNVNTDPDALEELARDESLAVRLAVAGNEASPLTVVGSLARSSNELVAITALANPMAPKSAVLNASHSPLPGVRRASARAVAADEEILARLSNDPDETVRRDTLFVREMRGI